MKQKALPRTPSQIWAKKNRACRAGRRRLGKRSIGEYWMTVKGPNTCGDLYWIVRKLLALDLHGAADKPEWFKAFYELTGRRATSRTLRRMAREANFAIPVGLL